MDGNPNGQEAGGKVLGRTFWIQGRTGPYWQNLESQENGQAAIARLGMLVSDDRYDELRLIQADLSPITGKTSYTHIVTVRDGHVMEPGSVDKTPASAPHPVANEPQPAPEPQMHFWPEPHPEDIQPSLELSPPGRENGYPQHPASPQGAAQPPYNAYMTGPVRPDGYAGAETGREFGDRGRPTQTPYDGARSEIPYPGDDAYNGRQNVGGWPIPQGAAGGWPSETEMNQRGPDRPRAPEPRTAAAQPQAPTQSQRTASERQSRRGLSLDPTDRKDSRGRVGGRGGGRGRNARSEGALRRGLRRIGFSGGEQRSGGGRVALLSGVFAGAIAAGLALASLSPTTAARFYSGLVHDVQGLLPESSLVEAIESGDIRRVRARLLEGGDPNAVDGEGTPILLRAARGGNLAAVTLLLQAGADPTLPMSEGRSVLHHLAAEGRSQALARMLAAGAPTDLAGGVYGCLTPLAVASANGRVRAAGLLAEQGASLNPQNGCDVGPLDIAAAHPHVLARLEQIRADRESILRLAAGPAPVDDGAPTDTRPAPQAVIAPDPGGAAGTAQQQPNTRGGSERGTTTADAVAVLSQAAREVSTPAQETFTPPPRVTGTQNPLPPLEKTTEPKSTNVRAPLAPKGTGLGQTQPVAAAPAPQAVRPTAQPQAQPTAQPQAQPTAQTGAVAALTPSADDGTPRARPKPTPPGLTQEQFNGRMRAAIDADDAVLVKQLLSQVSPGVRVARAKAVVHDRFGAGSRLLIDHAALNGRQEIAQLLIDAGARPSPFALHTAIKHAGTPGLREAPRFLIVAGADVNAPVDGVTPLMRAALRGDAATATLLLESGANAAVKSDDGRTAADMAGQAGKPALQERILLAARADEYRNLMFGMSWSNTLADLRPRAETCKSIGDDFTACKMKTPAWVDDAAVVVAQFDGRSGNRLVALQIDSQPLTSPVMARDRFAAVVREIEKRLPTDHVGFSTANAPEGDGFFRALRPEVNSGSYFAYWPDQDKSRPVFVHLKLAGLNDSTGFYRVIIGNPFRAS